MPESSRTPAQSLAALKQFRAKQHEVDGLIDQESGLQLEDLDAAIAAMEEKAEVVILPRLKMGF